MTTRKEFVSFIHELASGTHSIADRQRLIVAHYYDDEHLEEARREVLRASIDRDSAIESAVGAYSQRLIQIADAL